MRARAGDPPRTMTQKVLAGRASDPRRSDDLERVRVDQVVLAREPERVLAEARALGVKRAAVETAVAYETRCVTVPAGDPRAPDDLGSSALPLGVLIARPGIGYPGPVHLERFGSPARLAVTDEARLASVGGTGMVSLVLGPSQLAEALCTGMVWVRRPRSVQVLLSGRVRPFVCVRDVALELLRRGLGEVVSRVDHQYGAPVVVEFTGPSTRLLSVPDRAVLCSLAPLLGASAALFVSDEKTEAYLRDQRRSKAHRALAPDPGAPCDDVMTVDLSAVDPLLMDTGGAIGPVRELADEPVEQVLLGGDSGISLRDMLAAAAFLRSKRVPPTLELLIAPPSRQILEVLAQSGALVDLIAAGARLIEPDSRVVTGELYPPRNGGLSLRTIDPEPGLTATGRFVVASAETLAYSVATGRVGDPRGFKRPVKITPPRALPTDDVLIIRKGTSKAEVERGHETPTGLLQQPRPWTPRPWAQATTLALVVGRNELAAPSAMLFHSLEDVRWAIRRATRLSPHLRAVIASHIPSSMVPILAGHGILALAADDRSIEKLKRQQSVGFPEPSSWNGEGITAFAGEDRIVLRWLAVGAEREWTAAGTASPQATRVPS